MIDLKKKIITGKSGTIYRIDPENISAGRWHYYMRYATSVALGVMFQEVFDSYVKMNQSVTTGNDILAAISFVKSETEEKIKFINRYNTQQAPKPLEMCALFCNEDGEDVGEFNDAIIAKKFEDWKHIPIRDFFLLSSEAIAGFREEYSKQMANEKGKDSPQV